MADTLTLLTMPHEQALPLIVEEQLQPGIALSYIDISTTTYGTDLRAYTKLQSSPLALGDPDWPYFGTATLQWTRLDLADFFENSGVDLWFYRDADFTATDIATLLSTIFIIVIESFDYVHENVALQSEEFVYTFKASPNSTRWKGQVDIRIVYSMPGPLPTYDLLTNQDGMVLTTNNEEVINVNGSGSTP